MIKEMKLRGIEVTLDTDIDGAGESSPDRVSGCWLIFNDYSGSLELANHLGGLEDSEGNFLPINPSTLTAVEYWAQSNGY
jgi:hypothetical protein